MKESPAYPFYKSLRFRFGLIFGFLFLVCLLMIAFILYKNVEQQLEDSFRSRLAVQAKNVLQKTEISPLVIPLPDDKEYFLLCYNNTKQTDTLFTNLAAQQSSLESGNWRSFHGSKTLATGGIVTIVYVLPADDLNDALHHLTEILFVYIPAVLLVSFIAAYFLSGFLLQPITNIIAKAGSINLQNSIRLIEEPRTKDELHRLVITLNHMLERIEKQSQQQNAFFASASHELRTPLSNMLTELQVMRLQHLSPQMQAMFNNQEEEVRRLKKLVNDFLLMSQLKAGALYANKAAIDITDCCLNAIETYSAKAKEKQMAIKIEFQPSDTDFIISADKSHCQIILNNALENAVKYGSYATVIHLLITKKKDKIALKISNQTNLVVEKTESLTKEFSRSDFIKDGFGLGLWITNQLLTMNDATLTLSASDNTFVAVMCFPF